jgi:hypothetical protein
MYVLAGLWDFDVLFGKPFRSYALVMLKIQPFLIPFWKIRCKSMFNWIALMVVFELNLFQWMKIDVISCNVEPFVWNGMVNGCEYANGGISLWCYCVL